MVLANMFSLLRRAVGVTPAIALVVRPIVMAVVLLAVFAPGVPTLAAEVSVSKGEILKAFDERVFVQVAGQNSRIILKWNNRIRLAILSDDGFPSDVLRSVADDIDRVANATGHPIAIATSNLNFVIVIYDDLDREIKARDEQIRPFFSNTAAYDQFFAGIRQEHLPCGHHLLMARDHAIVGFLLLADIRQPVAAKACLRDGLATGMGLVGGVKSALSTEDVHPLQARLSPADLVALNLLYNSRLRAGMTEQDAKKQIQMLLAPHG